MGDVIDITKNKTPEEPREIPDEIQRGIVALEEAFLHLMAVTNAVEEVTEQQHYDIVLAAQGILNTVAAFGIDSNDSYLYYILAAELEEEGYAIVSDEDFDPTPEGPLH